jgi:hypothetical protein
VVVGDEATAHSERLAPLVSLVNRLRGEVTELQGRWEALGEDLEAKRRRLRLAEATTELVQRREGEAAGAEGGKESAGDGTMRAEEHGSHAGQASVGCTLEISQRRCPNCDVVSPALDRLLLALRLAASVRAHQQRAIVRREPRA